MGAVNWRSPVGGEGDPPRRRCRAAAAPPSGVRPAAAAPDPGDREDPGSHVVAGEDQQPDHHREHQHHLHRQSRSRGGAHLLPDQAVDPEAEGQDQRDPRQVTERDGHQHHPHGRDGDRQLLQAAQSLPQEDRTQQDRDQGVDVVAEASLHESVLEHRPGEGEPVDREQARGAEQEREDPRRAQDRTQLPESPGGQQDQEHGWAVRRPPARRAAARRGSPAGRGSTTGSPAPTNRRRKAPSRSRGSRRRGRGCGVVWIMLGSGAGWWFTGSG